MRASARDPSSLTLPDTVPVVAADLDRPDTLPAALDGAGAVFCDAAASLHGFTDAARTAGVDRVLLLSSFVWTRRVADDSRRGRCPPVVDQRPSRRPPEYATVTPVAIAPDTSAAKVVGGGWLFALVDGRSSGATPPPPAGTGGLLRNGTVVATATRPARGR